MMRLLFAPASPYSAKVRMAAVAAGIPLEAVPTDTNAPPPELLRANPLGKIPVLILDDGETVFDSRVIMRQLDRLSGGRIFPADLAALLKAEKLEALADGVCDCLLAHVYERRARPQEKIHDPWLERQWSKATRGLDDLEARVAEFAVPPDAGTIALRAMLGYATLRFAGQWEAGREKLVDWAARFDERFPELSVLTPT